MVLARVENATVHNGNCSNAFGMKWKASSRSSQPMAALGMFSPPVCL